MAKIIGNTTTTPMAIPDWNQTDENKADYIKNKPILGDLATKSQIAMTDLASDIQESLENVHIFTDVENGKRYVLQVINGKLTMQEVDE